jgi:hypothetical protein
MIVRAPGPGQQIALIPDRNPTASEFIMIGRWLRMMMDRAVIAGEIIDMPWSDWPAATEGGSL